MHNTFFGLVASAAILGPLQSHTHFHQCLLVNVTSDNTITCHYVHITLFLLQLHCNYNSELSHCLTEKTGYLVSDFLKS